MLLVQDATAADTAVVVVVDLTIMNYLVLQLR